MSGGWNPGGLPPGTTPGHIDNRPALQPGECDQCGSQLVGDGINEDYCPVCTYNEDDPAMPEGDVDPAELEWTDAGEGEVSDEHGPIF